MRFYKLLALSALVFLTIACSAGQIFSKPDIQATLDVALQQTLTAQPTATATVTPEPTITPSPVPSATPTEEPTATPETGMGAFTVGKSDDGWTMYSSDDIKISLPKNWVFLDLTAEDLSKMFAAAGEANSSLSKLFSSDYVNQLASAGIKFMAIDPDPESMGKGYAPNINVMIMDLNIPLTLDNLADITIAQLETMLPDAKTSQKDVTVSGFDAKEIVYTTTLNTTLGTEVSVTATQYLMMVGKKEIILSFSLPTDRMDHYAEIVKRVTDTFEIKQ